MKKIISIAAVLAAMLSAGTTMALADGGGETGSDTAHTAPYWQPDDASNYYMEEQGAAAQRAAPQHRSRRTFEER